MAGDHLDLSETGGVKPMSIAGRMVRERERCIGMTDAERAWRRQWLKDQVLAPNEPRYVPEYWRERINPLRRFYRAPLDAFYKIAAPRLGEENAMKLRIITGKLVMGYMILCAVHYYFKYNSNDWTTKSGWRIVKNRKASMPGDPDFPSVSTRSKGSDYASRGFEQSPI